MLLNRQQLSRSTTRFPSSVGRSQSVRQINQATQARTANAVVLSKRKGGQEHRTDNVLAHLEKMATEQKKMDHRPTGQT